MSAISVDLKSKPCQCGKAMEQIIGFNHRSTDDTYQPYRVGWYCRDCKAFEKAILRERTVELQ